MKAGKELDFLIADVIFGVKPTRPDDDVCAFWESGKCLFWGRCGFSQDIWSAWEVVEKLNHFPLALEYDNSFGWKATFDGNFVVAKTAPLAICLAALKAIRIDSKSDEEGRGE